MKLSAGPSYPMRRRCLNVCRGVADTVASDELAKSECCCTLLCSEEEEEEEVSTRNRREVSSCHKTAFNVAERQQRLIRT